MTNLSCQSLEHREQYDHQAFNYPLNSTDITGFTEYKYPYSTLDMAYSPSESMTEFENKLINDNPLAAKNLIDRPHLKGINTHLPLQQEGNIENFTFTNDTNGPSLKKLNEKEGKIIIDNKNGYNPYLSFETTVNPMYNQLGGTYYDTKPLSTYVKYPLYRNHGYDPTLLGSNLLEGYEETKESTLKLVLKLIILVIIVLFAIYALRCLLCDETMNVQIIKSPSNMSEVKRILNKMIVN
uniref:Uncharacterized protein n=1 Tax=viral metagenome TaxID=1070528 RepID=A0A6C0LU84_9ZZZZ